MKKILIAVLLLGMFIGASHYEHNYTRYDCVVVDFSEEGALVEDRCGEMWYIEETGLKENDLVDLKMHDNFTSAYIDDDIIKKVVKK